MTNAMLDSRSGTNGNAMLWNGPPQQQQPWYRQPGYRPTNFMLDAANKAAGVVSDFVWPILSGDLHRSANEYELGGRGEQELPRQAMNAAGAVMGGSTFARAPHGALRSFAGRNAKTADTKALARAEAMDASGIPRDRIWNDTGWFQGVDGQWRWEIDDSVATAGRGVSKGFGDPEGAFYHPGVAQAYPDTSKIRVSMNPDASSASGSYTPRSRTFLINESIDGAGRGYSRTKSAGLHEMQHAIQQREGFTPGSNPNKSVDHYNRNAGEVEARAVQSRMFLTPEQRRARAPWLDYDISERDQIIR